MITFETVRWKNFLSTGNTFTEIGLHESSSTLMIGRNGSGKSTILDALCFGLFNKPFRKINKPQLVNSINEKECVVEIEFTSSNIKYKIVRGIKPAKFEVYKDGKLLDQDAATKDTQKYLEQSILKLNYKSFTQVVILGSSTFVPFMQLPAAHRREVIEDLLDIGIFSNMNVILKDRINVLKQKQIDCEHMMKLCSEKVVMQKKHIDSIEQIKEERLGEKAQKISANKNEIHRITGELGNLKRDIESKAIDITKRKEVSEKLDKLKDVRARVSQKRNLVRNELKFFLDNDVCPTCTQNITPEFKEQKKKSLDEKDTEYKDAIDQMVSKVDVLVEELHSLEEQSRELQTMRSIHISLEREIVRMEFENLNIEKEIQDLQTNQTNVEVEKTALVEYSKELESTSIACSQVDKEFDEYRIISNLLKDSGIKSRIIRKYIPVFNQLINKYLQSMDFYVNFSLDENFDEKIMSRFRDDFSYASFSEGEKQKIDLALLFTWREIARMKNSVSTNLLILDEVFDSSLDESGTQELMKILRNLGNDANIFVISHKGEILVDKFLRTAIFEKVNDFSKMKYDG